MLLPAAPPRGVGCQGHLLWQDFQLGDALAEGWLQTFSPPCPHGRLKPWRQMPGAQAAAEALPPDRRFANTQGKVHKTAPSHCFEELRSCSSWFPRGVFPGQQFIHQPPPRPALKTLKRGRFFTVCMRVKRGQSTGKQNRPKTKAQAQKEVKKHQA